MYRCMNVYFLYPASSTQSTVPGGDVADKLSRIDGRGVFLIVGDIDICTYVLYITKQYDRACKRGKR
jgi:hypothetical protein